MTDHWKNCATAPAVIAAAMLLPVRRPSMVEILTPGADNRFREDGGNESQSKQSQEEKEASTHERESHHGADIAVEVDSGIDEIDGVS